MRVTAVLNTTSVSIGTTTFYLFRRQGDQLVLIFETQIGQSNIDKTSDASPDEDEDQIVRFDRHKHQGAYELIVADPRHRASTKRYFWNGSRYVEAAAKAGP